MPEKNDQLFMVDYRGNVRTLRIKRVYTHKLKAEDNAGKSFEFSTHLEEDSYYRAYNTPSYTSNGSRAYVFESKDKALGHSRKLLLDSNRWDLSIWIKEKAPLDIIEKLMEMRKSCS